MTETDSTALEAENARLSALVSRMREAFSELHALECAGDDPELPSYSSLRREVEALLSDAEVEQSTEELRLLRQYEKASLALDWMTLQSPGADRSKAISARDLAWGALRAFRERAA